MIAAMIVGAWVLVSAGLCASLAYMAHQPIPDPEREPDEVPCWSFA